MTEPIECPSCQEIVEGLTVEGVCGDCKERQIEEARRFDFGGESCEPDHVVRALAPTEG